MPELTAANIEQVVQTCRANLGAIGHSLNQCFDTAFQLSLGESLPASRLGEIGELSGPGLILSFQVGSKAVVCAISANLPMPDWHRTPNLARESRLQVLAQEWSFRCLPEELPGDDFAARAVPSLGDFIAESAPTDEAVCLPVLAASGDEPATAQIWLIWPVARVPAPALAADPLPDSDAAILNAGLDPATNALPRDLSNTYNRLRNLPVPVIVKLAEKKIELGQLLGIGPGAIITFEKPCEDLLELYVNNRLYCRGEAVKIGEKFGLKVCQTGSVHSRASALMSMESRPG